MAKAQSELSKDRQISLNVITSSLTSTSRLIVGQTQSKLGSLFEWTSYLLQFWLSVLSFALLRGMLKTK